MAVENLAFLQQQLEVSKATIGTLENLIGLAERDLVTKADGISVRQVVNNIRLYRSIDENRTKIRSLVEQNEELGFKIEAHQIGPEVLEIRQALRNSILPQSLAEITEAAFDRVAILVPGIELPKDEATSSETSATNERPLRSSYSKERGTYNLRGIKIENLTQKSIQVLGWLDKNITSESKPNYEDLVRFLFGSVNKRNFSVATANMANLIKQIGSQTSLVKINRQKQDNHTIFDFVFSETVATKANDSSTLFTQIELPGGETFSSKSEALSKAVDGIFKAAEQGLSYPQEELKRLAQGSQDPHDLIHSVRRMLGRYKYSLNFDPEIKGYRLERVFGSDKVTSKEDFIKEVNTILGEEKEEDLDKTEKAPANEAQLPLPDSEEGEEFIPYVVSEEDRRTPEENAILKAILSQINNKSPFNIYQFYSEISPFIKTETGRGALDIYLLTGADFEDKLSSAISKITEDFNIPTRKKLMMEEDLTLYHELVKQIEQVKGKTAQHLLEKAIYKFISADKQLRQELPNGERVFIRAKVTNIFNERARTTSGK